VEQIWRVEMFGTLRATRDDQNLTRFRTRRVAILLAFLSYYRTREYTREELGEMLWPEQEEEAIRRNLRQALHSLRHVLEPPPLPAGSILVVKQSRVSLNRSLVATDIEEFENLAAMARAAKDPAEQAALNQQAIALYRGELLPGFYEDWVLRERLKMEDLYVSCLRSLIAASKKENQYEEAILYLRRALAQEPLQEEWHTDLMEQYLRADRPASALKQYRELEGQLRDQLGCAPSARSKSLAEMARRAATISTGDDKSRHRAPPQAPKEPKNKPPVEAPTSPSARLPLQMTRFFGRQTEIEQVRSLFTEDRARLVSLLGPAGTGKTRLAIEVAREMSSADGWNVWFTPLADLLDSSMLLDEIADSMHARQANQPEIIDQISSSIKGETNLLILDNLEHILESGVEVIAQLRERVPNLRLLITSRQSLKLTAEQEYLVDPLPVPSSRTVLTSATREELAALAEYPSIQIFLDRSQAIRPDAQLTTSNAASIAAICSMLEGMPLAIELAAGQTSFIAPSQMLKHLDRRLTALSTRRRDATARHRSLRAAIDYSYESLPPKLQRFFASLSVFRGGFTVESAFEVGVKWMREQSKGIDEWEFDSYEACLGAIIDLQERSLVRPDLLPDDPDPRFRTLESFRQYGEELLTAGERHALKTLHSQYFLSRFADLPEHASAEDHKQLILRIQTEHENFVAALEFLFQAKEYETCVRLLNVMSKSWLHEGPRVIEREYIRQISILTRNKPIEPFTQIRLLRMLGTTYIRASNYSAAHQAMESAVEVALQTGDDEQIATCYAGLSTCAGFMGRMEECFQLNEKALEKVSDTNYELLERIHLGLGAVHWGAARLVEAERAFQLAKKMSERARGGEPDAMILVNLARTSLDLDRPEDAMSIVGEAMRICQRLGDHYTLAQCMYLEARYHWRQNNLSEALATNRQALMLGQEVAFGFLSLFGVRNHALFLCEAEEWGTATALLAATHSFVNMHRTLDDRDFDRARELCFRNLSKPDFEREWARGLRMSGDESLKLALSFR
jgi:predicted ATPase/DNA-binding SARP family transcriptional activator